MFATVKHQAAAGRQASGHRGFGGVSDLSVISALAHLGVLQLLQARRHVVERLHVLDEPVDVHQRHAAPPLRGVPKCITRWDFCARCASVDKACAYDNRSGRAPPTRQAHSPSQDELNTPRSEANACRFASQGCSTRLLQEVAGLGAQPPLRVAQVLLYRLHLRSRDELGFRLGVGIG